MNLSKRILVAPLNWGLGHATRCIPIINALIAHGYSPIIASDGQALELLKKEFPNLEFIVLPSYDVTYAKKGKNLKFKLLRNSPKMLQAISKERRLVKKLIKEAHIHGIISDNRLGVYDENIPSVFITHQLRVMSGKTTWLTTKMHQQYISKFDECWVPDVKDQPNLAGDLSHNVVINTPIKYIGVISRFNKKIDLIENDLLVLLSGPEPQRTELEKQLLKQLTCFDGNVLFVKGVIENEQEKTKQENLTIYNYMTSKQLEDVINKSKLILSRSGYTTIMDLAKLGKNAFFIPTPGQYEQEYLAKYLTQLGLVPYCKQDEFIIEKLKEANNYKGFDNFESITNYKELFSLFECK